MATRYELIDTLTGNVIKSYSPAQRNAARRRADKLSVQHGSYRYVVKPIFA